MSTNAELKKIVNEFYTLYEDVARTTRTAAMANLPAGAPAPEESVIYGEAGRNTFAKEAAKLLARAEQLINAKVAPIKARVTAAPSEEAVNAVTMLSLNKDISETDVDLLLEKYADNYQTVKALKSVAAEKGLEKYRSFTKEPDIIELEALEKLKASLAESLNIYSAEQHKGNHSMAKWVLEMAIDRVIAD